MVAKESPAVHRMGRSFRGLSGWPPFTGPGRLAILPCMTIRKIARMGHPILRRPAAPIADPTDPKIQALIADMIETMEDANGAGLAAPQVYESVRLVVFQAPAARATAEIDAEESFDHTAPLTVLINPEITPLSADLELGWEGCLSVPGLRGLVPRYREIAYRGLNAAGEMIERRAKGFHARVVQHECDHLDGILYPQRMTDMRGLIFETEVRHWMERAPSGEQVAQTLL